MLKILLAAWPVNGLYINDARVILRVYQQWGPKAWGHDTSRTPEQVTASRAAMNEFIILNTSFSVHPFRHQGGYVEPRNRRPDSRERRNWNGIDRGMYHADSLGALPQATQQLLHMVRRTQRTDVDGEDRIEVELMQEADVGNRPTAYDERATY